MLLIGQSSSGYVVEASLERTLQSDGLRIAPPEYLLIHSAREGTNVLARAISERFKIDWAFLDEAMAREWDRWDPPVARMMRQVMRQVRKGSASV